MNAAACRGRVIITDLISPFFFFLFLHFNPFIFFRIVSAPSFIFIAFKDEEEMLNIIFELDFGESVVSIICVYVSAHICLFVCVHMHVEARRQLQMLFIRCWPTTF